MPVTTIYRAEVEVPQDVYLRFSGEHAYKTQVLRLVEGASEYGTNPYDYIEWAEFHTLRDAQDFCGRWHNYILELQGIIRSYP